MKNPLFYAKILLFGEYGIIEDSQGLTLPYNFYKGSLKFINQSSIKAKQSNASLQGFARYLAENIETGDFQLDMDRLHKDLDRGMYFDSNIPQGYGVGSSGALVAALYEKYCTNKWNPSSLSPLQISELKSYFGKMESYFHGKSSGIDPLICYMNIPLHIESKENINTVGIPESQSGKGAIFLLNSGSPGKTGPMVEIFFEKLKNEGFRKTLKEEFIAYNDACIESFVNRDFTPFFENLKKLSRWAFVNFQPMIPKRFLRIWEEGISTNAYYLKLCGSGGGGYILGFTQDFDKAQEMLKEYQTEVIYRF